MYCPKCGTQNPDDGKFCRSCGVDLGGVSAALMGKPSGDLCGTGVFDGGARRKSDPNEVFAEAVRNIIFGIGFFFIAGVLFFTNVAGGRAWWWAMLFPAFSFMAKGVSDYVKYGRMESPGRPAVYTAPPELSSRPVVGSLPASATQYISPDKSSYKTGDLVPPSVTDNTTRHLEMDTEGETMTLPKK